MASLLDSDTSELEFQFEEKKQLYSSIKLRNPTKNHVAFKILCTRPRRYGVHPWLGILSPGGSCEVTVKTQAPGKAPTNMVKWQSRDRDIFKIRSVLARPDTTKEDAPNLFNPVAHMIEESRLRVFYTLPQARDAALGAHDLTESSSATTPEVINSVVENQRNDLQVDESRSIVEASESQQVHISVRDWKIHIGALILKCFICTLIFVASFYLMKQLIWALMKSMVMLMMKMVTKSVSESIEDWVAQTLFCVFMSLVCKYKEWPSRMLRASVWDQVMDLTNWKTKLIQMLTNWKMDSYLDSIGLGQ